MSEDNTKNSNEEKSKSDNKSESVDQDIKKVNEVIENKEDKKDDQESIPTKASDKDKKDDKKKERLDLKSGMTVRVHQKIKEINLKGEEKERIQYFEGIIIAKKHGNEAGATITIRKISNGVGVEKIFPLNLPSITKIEVKKQAQVKRAKLGFLKRGYKKRLKEKKVDLVEIR